MPFPYTFPFYFDVEFGRRVRAFVARKITSADTLRPQYVFGNWQPTGSHTYKVRLDRNKLKFYIDGTLKDEINLSDIILDGNVQFGQGHPHNWNRFRFQLIDTAYSSQGVVSDFCEISGSISHLEIKDLSEGIAYYSGGSWTYYGDRKLWIQLGWNYDNVVAESYDQNSINTYGLHLKRISEPLAHSEEDAKALADRYVAKYKDGVKTTRITIKGKTGIDITKKVKVKIPEMNVNEDFEVASYIHEIDKRGFRTTLHLGQHPYDLAGKVAKVEKYIESYGTEAV